MDWKSWTNKKKSGGFKRKIKKKRQSLMSQTETLTRIVNQSEVRNDIYSSGSAGIINNTEEKTDGVELENTNYQLGDMEHNGSVREIGCCEDKREIDTDDSSGSEDLDIMGIRHNCNSEKDSELRSNIRQWALEFNIPQIALKGLCALINKRLPHVLPSDPRTLLLTNDIEINIIQVDTGYYWHNGLIDPLRTILENVPDVPHNISLNINIDGLPIYKSSKQQFWPILCNIFELPHISPLVIGIYAASNKPSDLHGFLGPFVVEMQQLFENGILVYTQERSELRIGVKIRAFICDSPARALLKGVCNFNGKHGCLKCTVVGEYSHVSHTVIFPTYYCERRNNEDFRAKKYGLHHKNDTPLLKLPIDIVDTFPVSDSLHLLDLGIMKRLLLGWRDGNFGTFVTKWNARETQNVSSFLLNCKLPKEIHRSVRGLDVLSYWKATEFRSFLYYISFVVLQQALCVDAYEHFLTFFCAVTICSNEKYFHFLSLGERLMNFFVEHFRDIYGEQYTTSNVHNLCHVFEEVRRFGILQSFNAYPFENKLQFLKKMVRNGNKPLTQIAKRLNEINILELEAIKNKQEIKYPFFKTSRNITTLYLKGFILSTQSQDKWLLNSENNIVEITSIFSNDEKKICLRGNCIRDLEDVFVIPVKSSTLYIYKCSQTNVITQERVFKIEDVKAKLVCIPYQRDFFYAPLLHTLM